MSRSKRSSAPSSGRFEALKALIEEAASDVPEIGALEESEKWGQPRFAPAKSNVGSSVRSETRADGDHALMFICTSGLVEEFRTLYDDTLQFDGKRAIVIPSADLPDRSALKHCIQLALTHKLRKRQSKGRHPRA
ncbi:MAG: DUF1801 domain-containing protein [Cohaesibacteraceae bacterium]